MDLWMDLLFGNPVGLMCMLVVFGTIIVAIVLFKMLIRKSGN